MPAQLVAAEVVEQGRGDKIIVFKKKRRKGYRRTKGHRQLLTTIRITEILTDGKKPSKQAAKPEPKKAEKPVEAKAPKTGRRKRTAKPAKKAEAKPAAKKAAPKARSQGGKIRSQEARARGEAEAQGLSSTS